MISLEDQEQGGLLYKGEAEELGEIYTRWCLVGHFPIESLIDFQAMHNKMAYLWRYGKCMYVKQLEPNHFIFQFNHEVDIKQVVEGSLLSRFHLIFERLKEGENPRSEIINKLDVLVQLHGMNAGFKIWLNIITHIVFGYGLVSNHIFQLKYGSNLDTNL